MPSGSYELTSMEKADPDAIESNNAQEDVQELQEPLDENEKNEKEHKYGYDSPHAISWMWPVVTLAVGCLLYYLIHLQDHNLPTPITADQAIAHPGIFSAERSRNSLRKMTSFGPRVVGDYANEVLTPEMIEEEVREAIYNAHSSQSILLERQKGSGAYHLGFSPGFTNIYDNIQNVLVLLEGTEGNHNILVNCHYDTIPSVDGASDDGISCAVMLELIRALSVLPKRLKHNVLFLFNGAEETPLEGSHLYLQHRWANKSRIVLNLEAAGQGGRAVLFQSGPNNAWLFRYYAKYAPHPHALVIGEELFQNGFIPSDTDFRIFRDFGKLPGLDFAFCRNGYAYHTRYDSEVYIPLGSHQHMGDNTLALLKSLGHAPELENMEANAAGQVVFFDFIGWFLVSYSYAASVVLNLFVILLSIFSIVIFIGRMLRWSWLPQSTGISGKKFEKFDIPTIMKRMNPIRSNSKQETVENTAYIGVDEQHQKSNVIQGGTVINECTENESSKTTENKDTAELLKESTAPNHNLKTFRAVIIEFSIAVVAQIAGQLAAMAVGATLGAIIDASATLTMPWYSNIWLIFPLYWLPCASAYALVPNLINCWRAEKRGLSLVTTTHMNLIAVQVPFILLMFYMTCSGTRSACVFLLPLLCGAISNLVIHLTPLYNSVHKWIWVYLAIHIPSILFTFYLMLIGYMFLIPVMARSGTINGDVYIGFVSSLLVILVTSFAMPLMGLVRKQKIMLMFLGIFSLVMLIISLTSSIGFPYRPGPNEPALQRYWIMHSDRLFYNESQMLRRRETGYFVLNLDRNSPRTLPLKKRNIRSLQQDCNEELYCGLPLYMTRMVPLSPASSWIPALPPNQPHNTELQLKNRCQRSPYGNTRCDLDLVLKGPDRMTLTFAPREGAELVGWSVPSPTTPSGVFKGRPSYYLHIVRGEMKYDYNITLTFSVTTEQKNGAPILDIALAGNHIHHEKNRTKEFQSFLDSFPDWVMMTGWISAYRGYVF